MKTLHDLEKEYDRLQLKYGAKELNSIYHGGCAEQPDVCFVFMNPTQRNIAAFKTWKGLRAPWIGTKNIWTLFHDLGLVSEEIFEAIRSKKGIDWTESFAEEVYEDVKKHRYFITNLGKCTQVDARVISDAVYKKYLHLLEQEFAIIRPKVIILFGNQVSSIVLGEKISVSQVRRKCFTKTIGENTYHVYSVYYPVGNGRFHMGEAVEDILYIMEKECSREKV